MVKKLKIERKLQRCRSRQCQRSKIAESSGRKYFDYSPWFLRFSLVKAQITAYENLVRNCTCCTCERHCCPCLSINRQKNWQKMKIKLANLETEREVDLEMTEDCEDEEEEEYEEYEEYEEDEIEM